MQYITKHGCGLYMAAAPEQIFSGNHFQSSFNVAIWYCGMGGNFYYHAKDGGLDIAREAVKTKPFITAAYLEIDAQTQTTIFVT